MSLSLSIYCGSGPRRLRSNFCFSTKPSSPTSAGRLYCSRNKKITGSVNSFAPTVNDFLSPGNALKECITEFLNFDVSWKKKHWVTSPFHVYQALVESSLGSRTAE